MAELDGGLALSRDELIRRLWEGDPRIEVGPDGERTIFLNPDPLKDGEAEIVIERIRAALGA